MKDIYDHLNDIDMDLSQFEEEAVNDIEKETIKMKLKRSIRTTKPARWRKMATAASFSIGLSAAALFGLSFTSFAQEIPILGNMFSLFNGNGLYDSYDDSAQNLEISNEKNGVKITVNDTVFDGKTLYFMYSIESDIDLGESPELKGMYSLNDTLLFSWFPHDIIKDEGNKYIGMIVAHLTEGEVYTGSFDFMIESVIPDLAVGDEIINGNWEFHFELEATENIEQLVNQNTEQHGVTVAVKKAIYTPMSFLLLYDEIITEEIKEKWDFVTVDIIVKDDIGNLYTGTHNGGSSNSFTMLHHSNTFEKLHPEATKLIITPNVTLSEKDGTDEENGSIYRNINSTAPMEEFQLKDIVFEIKR